MIVVVAAAAVVAVAVAVAGFAVDRRRRTARTRRQTVEALAAVPRMAGVPTSCDLSDLATAVAADLGLPAADVAATTTAARLCGLGALAPAAAVGRLATESGLPPSVTTVLYEALTTDSVRCTPAAAAVRVVRTYDRFRTEPHLTSTGALFATVKAHPAGSERQAAAALVRVVQGEPARA